MKDKKESTIVFSKQINELNLTKISDFSKICNKLLDKNFIIKSRKKDLSDYFFMMENLSLFQNYFSIIDYDVAFHRDAELFSIKPLENNNRHILRKTETIFLLILRQLYYLESKKVSESSKQIFVTSEDIHENLAKTGLFEERLNRTEFTTLLRLFKRYSIIDFTKLDDAYKSDFPIIIYPSINYIVSISKIEELEQKINSYRGDSNEEINED